jgi:hypothetical protein
MIADKLSSAVFAEIISGSRCFFSRF